MSRQPSTAVPERFDWEQVGPGPLDALAQAIADRITVDGWCSNSDAMEVLGQLWDEGYRLVRHPWLDADPLPLADEELMARYRAARASDGGRHEG